MTTERKRQLAWIGGLFLVVVLLDQLTKEIIRRTIPADSITFAGREEVFFFFTHYRNFGLVGGAFQNNGWVAFFAPLIAMGVLLYLFRHLHKESRWQSIAYGVVAGGAVGNLIDRIRLGWVTDFLQFHFYFIPFDFPWKKYPAFNVADAAICVGVVLLVVTWHLAESARTKAEEDLPSEAATAASSKSQSPS